MDDLEKRKEYARELAWATYIDILESGKADPKVRREAAKDILESVGDLVSRPKVVDAKQFVLNIDPLYLEQASKVIKELMGGSSDTQRDTYLLEGTTEPD